MMDDALCLSLCETICLSVLLPPVICVGSPVLDLTWVTCLESHVSLSRVVCPDSPDLDQPSWVTYVTC